jgi:hypothetical protein
MRLRCFTVASRTSGKGLQAVLVARGLLQQHSRKRLLRCSMARCARCLSGVCIIGSPSGAHGYLSGGLWPLSGCYDSSAHSDA